MSGRALRLGLAQGPVPTDPTQLTPDLAKWIADLGVKSIVTHFSPAPDDRLTGRVREALDQAGLTIAQAGGCRPNLIAPDDATRRGDVARLGMALRGAAALGAEMVITGCGSHHPSHPYGPSPDNHSVEARRRLVESLGEVAEHAEDTSVVLALEPHVMTTLDTPERTREILDAVDSPKVRANFDPVNFLGSLPALYGSAAEIAAAARTIGPRLAPSAHLKDANANADFVVQIVEVPPGEGLVDLGALLRTCVDSLPPESTLIIEHLEAPLVATALARVRELATAEDIEFG